MRSHWTLGVVLVAVACTPAPKADVPAAPTELSATELDAVKAVDAAFAAGMNAKDTAAVYAVYAADAKLLAPDAPSADGVAGHAVIAGLMAAGASDFALTPTLSYGVGDLAYTVGTASFKLGGASDSIKYLEVLRKGTDGKWRYVADMFNSVAPAPAPAKK